MEDLYTGTGNFIKLKTLQEIDDEIRQNVLNSIQEKGLIIKCKICDNEPHELRILQAWAFCGFVCQNCGHITQFDYNVLIGR